LVSQHAVAGKHLVEGIPSGELGGTMALNRSRDHKMIAGVCGGIAEHYGWSVGLVRFLFLLTGLFGAGEIAYIVLWIVMPKE
jgi:phage shock protein C